MASLLGLPLGQAPSCTPICKNIYPKSVKGLKILAYATFIFKKWFWPRFYIHHPIQIWLYSFYRLKTANKRVKPDFILNHNALRQVYGIAKAGHILPTLPRLTSCPRPFLGLSSTSSYSMTSIAHWVMSFHRTRGKWRSQVTISSNTVEIDATTCTRCRLFLLRHWYPPVNYK